jgi:diguanylate cyclase (GGDEF)-like protein
MQVRSSQDNNGHHAGNFGRRPRLVTLNNKAKGADGEITPPARDLEGSLSCALLAGDKELGNVVREVDEIAKALRSGSTDGETLRVAVHPAVWNAVRQTIVERELRYLALTDDLTCLYNRRGFFAAATQQLKLSQRNAHGVLLFFCDVDGLKQINDSFGHREGDLSLVRIADALESAFRDSDVLARLGGDEFAALAPEASNQDDAVILRRLEETVRKANADEPRYGLSLSVGVARFDPKRPISLGELMEKADQDMYEHKRNRPKLCSNNR